MAYYGFETYNVNGEEFDSRINPYAHPWRRYFAFSIDYSLYCSLYYFFFDALLKHPSSWYMDVLYLIMCMLIYLFMTSFLISRYKTTFGKWIWGFTVENKDGSNLSFFDSLSRTFDSIRWGIGFQIPIYNIVRIIISYFQSKKDERKWNEPYKYELKDLNGSRIAWFIAIVIILSVFQINTLLLERNILHKGEITLQEHIENVNRYMDINNNAYNSVKNYLDEKGQWKREREENAFSIDMFYDDIVPSREFFYNDEGNIAAYEFIIDESSLTRPSNEEFIYLADKYLDEVKVLVLALEDRSYLAPNLDFGYKSKLKKIYDLKTEEIVFDRCVVKKTIDVRAYHLMSYDKLFIKDDEYKDEDAFIKVKIVVEKK